MGGGGGGALIKLHPGHAECTRGYESECSQHCGEHA